MSVIDDSDNVVVNTNDCPYDLSYQASSEIMKNFDKIDLLLVGYTSASAFPQCFTMNDDKKKKVIQEMKILKRAQLIPEISMYNLILVEKPYIIQLYNICVRGMSNQPRF